MSDKSRSGLKPDTIDTHCLRMQVFSFKVRGAFNFLANMSEDARRGGVISASAGNHTQGVAMAARHLARPYMLLSCTSSTRLGLLPQSQAT